MLILIPGMRTPEVEIDVRLYRVTMEGLDGCWRCDHRAWRKVVIMWNVFVGLGVVCSVGSVAPEHSQGPPSTHVCGEDSVL